MGAVDGGGGGIAHRILHLNCVYKENFTAAASGAGGRQRGEECGVEDMASNAAPRTRTTLELTLDELFGAVEQEWQEQALCAQTDPEAFFPEKGGSTREAKRICQACAVRDECLEFALEHDERFGIWGGLSERERRRLKRDII